MIRIMTADGKESTKLTVEGALSDEGVETVHACCIQALSRGKTVRLWLSDVSAIGERGRTMLQRLAAAGVDLTANGIYNSSVVDEIKSAGRKERRCSR
jgi:hypothetical protein